MTIFDAALFGALEGLTEFLPVSSTGHLIMLSKLLGISQTDSQKAFEVIIQLGAILAVFGVYFKKIIGNKDLMLKLSVAFLPTGILGFILYKHIKELFVPTTTAYMLIIGGVVFILLEKFYKPKEHHITEVKDMSIKQALLVGLAQSCAMIPGTSRSGATIIGGLLSGLNRKFAVEFSFLLALPTMLIATAYDVLKHHNEMVVDDWSAIIVGFGVAFIVAFLAVKTFIKLISRISFVPFGIYRIVVGVLFLYYIS